MNTERPNYPRAYGFGRSAFVSEKSVERIVDASLGALASHDAEGGANTLVLLSVGEPQPIPLPASSTLQQNILQLDVLQLEFALLQQAQRQGVPGVGDRRQPLASLRQLLHHLQIPVAPHAPLGNAGNEAFYTVLAFQKLLMRDTRLPDQLFQQSAFAPQGEYFAQAPMPPMAPFGAAPYSPYSPGGGIPMSPGMGALPMPPPIRDGSRRGSSSSLNRFSLPPLDLEPPSFPAPMSRQNTGDRAPRPTTIADEMSSPGGGSRQPGRGSSSNGNGSALPNGGLPRSQTVYWDDAKYSENGSNKSQGRSTSSRPSPNSSNLGSSRGPNPPSSLRHSALFPGNMANSRSVSFHDGGGASMIRPTGDSSPGGFSRSSSATGLGNGGGIPTVSSNGHARGGSMSGGSGSGSASSGATSEASLTKPQNSMDSTASKQEVSDRGGVRKMKSEKSVKHLAGALAKFWVD